MGANHTIAKSWKRRYAQSSRTTHECSDSSLAGDKRLDDSDFCQFSASYFRLEKNVQLRSPSVRQAADEWRIMIFGRQAGTAVCGYAYALAQMRRWLENSDLQEPVVKIGPQRNKKRFMNRSQRSRRQSEIRNPSRPANRLISGSQD